ncbi:phage baseplate assembly protein V [Paenibacillus sp. GbtcB18]|uniref:phage baseplate assembly protein V n=1 Tax=Paenibacillus sp. GbtcB18 TaxID=2824763 RepID=UPI001C2FB9F6|nr:phage baseplate assembly protein V [Paenibacillus sp. GbtcB18]
MNFVKFGYVSSVNDSAGSVRVTFPDLDDQVSDELPLLSPQAGWSAGVSLPAPGEMVVCIFPEKGAEGVCLGTFSTMDRPPPGNADQRGTWFDDGSYVYYDRSSGVLAVKAVGRVRIEGDLEVTGTLTRGGDRL